MRVISVSALIAATLLVPAGSAAAAPAHIGARTAGLPQDAASCSTQQDVFPDVAPSTVPWAQTQLDFERAWAQTEGAGQVIGVVDSGVDTGNPQLPSDAVADGSDTAVGGSGLGDQIGHGTLVAGIAAARPEPGVAFVGVAPQAQLYSVRVAELGACISADAIAAGITKAAQHASVINVSIATTQPDAALQAAVEYAIANNVVVVCAAGNDQEQGNAPEYPASYPGVLSVGSIGPGGALSGFSSTGTPISVVAPGANIVTTGAQDDQYGLVGGQSVQGTSFAAPYVAGTAALVRATHPDLTAAQVVQRIEATADHPAGALPDPALGWGTVDPVAAVTAVLPGEAAEHTAVPAPAHLAAPEHTAAGHSSAGRIAAWTTGGALLAAFLVAGIAAAVPAGRRRGWRAAA